MMLVFVTVTAFLTLLYCGLILFLRRGFDFPNPATNMERPPVTLVVAARNEEQNIARCLKSLLQQNYPHDRLEIIIVDDRSEDRTAEIVRQIAQNESHVQLVQVQETPVGMAPKKHAIHRAIQKARGEVILTTDADCTPGPGWVSEMIKHFTPKVGLVAGHNPYRAEEASSRLFGKMMALDYFAMAAVAAASAALGFPVSCSGGNLAYRKQVYEEIGGFRRIGRWVSGDDDLFLEQVRDRTSWQIRYATVPETQVPTAPPVDFTAFVQQRIRYASKGLRYKKSVVGALAGFYLLNLNVVLGLLLTPVSPAAAGLAPAALLLKSCADFAFLNRASRCLPFKISVPVFCLTTIVYPFYIVWAGLVGQLATFKWKGQAYRGKLAGIN